MGTDVTGLVIRETAVGENDKALTVLTGGLGKITAWARSSRRINSNLRAASQLFTYANFSLVPASSGYRIENAQVIESFFELRRDMVRLALAGYFAELAGAVTDELLDEPRLLKLTLNSLHLLAKTDKPPPLLKAAYELRLMCLIGFLPDLSSCPCKKLESLSFNPGDGRLYCSDCKGESAGNLSVSAGVLDAMRFITTCPEQKMFSFQLDEEGLKTLSTISELFVMVQLERGFKTLDFYHSVLE